jgi:D-alanyl-D-alanine carboxypeptidase (penicillin-binding protein 5/6)
LLLIFSFFKNQYSFAETIIVPAPPKIAALSYLLMDFNSGKILVEENIHQKLPPASLTKMMTVYVVADELAKGIVSSLDEVIVSKKAYSTLGSRMFIEQGHKVKLEDLLLGVIVQSGNDASVALAEHVSGSEEVFVNLMNQHALHLGMKNTQFVNSTGMPVKDAEHSTTAHDLAILARALIRDYPEIYELHKIKEFTYGTKPPIKQYNRNQLLWRDRSVDGIKTGHTEEAGYCLVASAIRDNMRLISVVMGADGENYRAKASQTNLNYGYRFYETHKLYSGGDVITDVKVWKADADTLGLTVKDDLYITVPRGQYDKLESIVEINTKIIAPIKQGDRQGVLKILLSDESIASVPLLAKKAISKGNIFNRLKDEIHLMLFD